MHVVRSKADRYTSKKIAHLTRATPRCVHSNSAASASPIVGLMLTAVSCCRMSLTCVLRCLGSYKEDKARRHLNNRAASSCRSKRRRSNERAAQRERLARPLVALCRHCKIPCIPDFVPGLLNPQLKPTSARFTGLGGLVSLLVLVLGPWASHGCDPGGKSCTLEPPTGNSCTPCADPDEPPCPLPWFEPACLPTLPP